MVLAAHTGISKAGFGTNGVALFFVLSGYLLAQPFIEGKIGTISTLTKYLSRRVFRIVPMYTAYVLIAAVWHKYDIQWIEQHLTFKRSDGHLWSVKQELLFYVVLPFYFLFMRIYRDGFLEKAIGTIIIAALCDWFLGKNIFAMTSIAPGVYHKFHVAPFLLGIGAAYLARYFRERAFCIKYLEVGGIVALLAWGYIFDDISYKHHEYMASMAFMGMIVWLQHIPNSLSYRIVNSILLRAIGIVGYSFYLLHWLVRDIVIEHIHNPVIVAIVVTGVTYILSCITYSFIERPFMNIVMR